jgi:very-short-patch-repair endonuclease
LGGHIWRVHGEGVSHHPGLGQVAWNKGLTNATDERVQKNSEAVGKALTGKKQHPLVPQHRAFISESMKRAHAEGRAHNIGECRWKCEPSYPETFFMRVIENEFSDKKVIREHFVKPFALDFAWVHKKRAIEIDGQQHEQPVQKERDIRKDAFFLKLGWQLLRIRWVNMFANPQDWIAQANAFIGN